jgi:small subunit ribosomal protein S20
LGDIASAKKRARQSEKRRQHNISQRSLLRSSIKKVLTAVQTKDKSAATEASKAAIPVIDRMARKGFIHKNKAARHKQQLNNMLRGMA